MPRVTLVVPAYNATRTLGETLASLRAQTFRDFEIVVVDDGSTDGTVAMVEAAMTDPRLRLVRQRNRGLAGARNSGIAAARGDYIGFCDADDLWEPWKLQAHVRHLDATPYVGVSYAGSALIDDAGNLLRQAQRPRLTEIDLAHILKRNPVGNGSSPVIRRAVFDEIAYRPAFETRRDWYFDETFRQSEDIECWVRIALTTNWQFEGVTGLLTRYRISAGGLSAATDRQLASWEAMIAKLAPLDPVTMEKLAPAARAYQLRYLARRAISDGDAERAWEMTCRSWRQSVLPLVEEPVKTCITLAAACGLRLIGRGRATPMTLLKAGRA